MTRMAWLNPFFGRLVDEGIVHDAEALAGLAPAHAIRVRPEDWGRLAHQARQWGCRWVAGWGEDRDDDPQGAEHGAWIAVHACFEKDAGYLLARALVPKATPLLPSHTPHYPAANRPERHIQDMFGIAFSDHPDTRRWTRHRAWKNSQYPLRRDFPAAGTPAAQTPPDDVYKFLFAHGAGVYEIPVGPVHAGIIEPGHFRFQAVGEMVLNLEERLGYVHKGIEKIAEGRDPDALARLAGRVSGDSTVAHAWAACMAMEKAAGVEVPERALFLRAIMAERERIANHLGDIGAVCNDVAFSFSFYQFGRLREEWQRLSRDAFGHRFMMDCVVPGGVANDLADLAIVSMRAQNSVIRQELDKLVSIQNELSSLEDRLATTGFLSPELAATLGCLGYVGRASSVDFDLRRDAPYAPYERLVVNVPCYHYGDVAARVRVRVEEIRAALEMIETLLTELPAGKLRAEWRAPAAGSEGLGLVEGWRGEILTYVRFAAGSAIARYFPRDPSWLNWPALEHLIHDNIVPDFPVCNKSVNGSYSGSDL